MRRRWFMLLGLLVLSGCVVATAPAGKDARVLGKVSLAGAGCGNVVVSAWPAAASALAGVAPYRSKPSAANGTFALSLPPGEYYFLAHGDETFAYYGRNPVSVPAAGLDALKIGLVTRSPLPEPVPAEIGSGVSGRVLVQGVPRSDAVIFAYTDLSTNLKGMGYAMSVPSDADGRFVLPLPPGTYYLLARLRQQGGMVTGPLRAGDFIGYAQQNPVRIGANQLLQLSIPLLEVPEKVEQLAGSLFGSTSLRGRIVTRDGRPVSGARAILYAEPQMLNRPLFVSRPSDADGHFVLSFPQGGTYYLAARQQLGGAPAPGELYGTYDATPEHAVTIATGEERDGIELTVEEMW